MLKIDDETISCEDFIKLLKLSGKFDSLLEDVVKDKLTVHAAKKRGITISSEELQERADQLRRVRGLHRAKDALDFLDSMGLTLDDFEQFVIDTLYQEKIIEEICSDTAVEDYFKLHSPRFDSIEVSHILVESEGMAKELISLLEEEPDMFEELVTEHSLADTKEKNGRIGKVNRGAMSPEVEGKAFNAEPGDLLGPFASTGGTFYEIFRIDKKTSARLDEETKTEIQNMLRNEWLKARVQDHKVEV